MCAKCKQKSDVMLQKPVKKFRKLPLWKFVSYLSYLLLFSNYSVNCQIKFVEDIEDPRMAKSLIISYILWFFGGFVGLHHFYLNRTTQGFLWLCLPGKCFCKWFFTSSILLDQISSFKAGTLVWVGSGTFGEYQHTSEKPMMILITLKTCLKKCGPGANLDFR